MRVTATRNQHASGRSYCQQQTRHEDLASELVFGDGRGWMEREIERENAQIQDAALADPTKSYTNDQYTEAVEDMRKFARERADFVRSEIAAAR
jgi:hypothetical protein